MRCINEQEWTIWQFVCRRGDRLIEVKFTENKGTAFWELESVPLIEGDRLIEGSVIEFWLYYQESSLIKKKKTSLY